jgi:hypothetical protein
MERCVRCKSPDVHISRTRNRWEVWRREITGKRPFRCRACGWRGWAVDVGRVFHGRDHIDAERALAPDPPNLGNATLGRPPVPRPVELTELDFPDPPAGPDNSSIRQA